MGPRGAAATGTCGQLQRADHGGGRVSDADVGDAEAASSVQAQRRRDDSVVRGQHVPCITAAARAVRGPFAISAFPG